MTLICCCSLAGTSACRTCPNYLKEYGSPAPITGYRKKRRITIIEEETQEEIQQWTQLKHSKLSTVAQAAVNLLI